MRLKVAAALGLLVVGLGAERRRHQIGPDQGWLQRR
jgi:hypothetical protein